MSKKILLKNSPLANGSVQNVLIENETISFIGKKDFADCLEIDCQNKLVLPGIIDVHTHIRDMGLSYKEDWISASMAAAAGGITTLFDMPNTKPATFDAQSLLQKRQAAKKSLVNYGYNFGVTEYNADEIRQAQPIASLKMFMAESSSGYMMETENAIRYVFNLACEINKPVIIHSELQSCVEQHAKQYAPTIENHNKIRNRICAIKATQRVLKLAEETGASVYLAHIATADEINLIRQAKKKGLKNIFCEVTPHHLFINESVLKTAGNFGKVNPPLQTAEDNQAIEEGIIDGTVDTIGTDHAPHSLDEKNQAYPKAPSGFPGLETSLGLMLQLVHTKKISIEKLSELMATNPARIFNIKKRGSLQTGNYADLIIVDPDIVWKVKPEVFYSKAKYSPYSGMLLKGKVLTTIINGHIIYQNNMVNEITGKEIEFA